ncbi:unnamed protein product [Ceutorhynchus assimilis]|uniref:Acireductone dioxygenase n=1 Tax=Ceutorhynchus assimilis TaxID=467358 RepID=A0A9N9QKI4_9CUCU|nr:unnamed protein product [Ceutorhynchus assimilis]
MVQAWYMDNAGSNEKAENHKNPPEFVSLQELFKKTGVEYYKLNLASLDSDGILEKLKTQRGYTYEDQVTIRPTPDKLEEFEKKLKIFYTEHLHTDEEIRLCVEGAGYFDVRDKGDDWIRVRVDPGDLLIIPAGIYHRFTVDDNKYIVAKRFFVGEPVWTPHNRPADEIEARKDYIDKLQNGKFVIAN